jgi:hypothetical protein
MLIFVPLGMTTSPPRMPASQAPIQVMVMVMLGGASGGERMVMVSLELKSPLTSARVVRAPPGPKSQLDTLVHEPSGLWEKCSCLQLWARRTDELNTEFRAADASSTHDFIDIGRPAITMSVRHIPTL